jgi:hypothetical protein
MQNVRAKEEMNVEFEKNRLKPTDKEFVYDVKVSFMELFFIYDDINYYYYLFYIN